MPTTYEAVIVLAMFFLPGYIAAQVYALLNCCHQ